MDAIFRDANHKFWNRAFMALFAAVVLLLFTRLGDYPLQMQWEPNYGMVLQEMVWGEGDEITPSSRVGGDEGATPNWFFSKPVGIFWGAMPFFKLFASETGREWATRAGNATCGLIGIWFVYFLMRRLYDARTGFYTALVYSTMPIYYIVSRAFMVDILFVNFWTIAWGYYLLAEKEKKARFYDLFFAFLGISALAKGLTPILLSSIVLLPYWALRLDTDALLTAAKGRKVAIWAFLLVNVAANFAGLTLLPSLPNWIVGAAVGGIFILLPILAYPRLHARGLAYTCSPAELRYFQIVGGLIAGTFILLKALTDFGLVTEPTLAGSSRGLFDFTNYFQSNAAYVADLFQFQWASIGDPGSAVARFALALQFSLFLAAAAGGVAGLTWVFQAELRRMRFGRGLLIFMAVGGVWYIYMTTRFGWHYFDNFLVGHHFRRVEGRLDKPNETFEWFVLYFLFGILPWVGFLPVAYGSAVNWFGKQLKAGPETFFVVGFTICFTFFSVINTKFAHYIFPVAPFAALLIGRYLGAAVDLKQVNYSRLSVVVSILVFMVVAPDLLDQKNYRVLLYFMTTERLQDWHGSVGDPSRVVKLVYAGWVAVGAISFLGAAFFRYATWVLGALAYFMAFFIATTMIPELCWMFSAKSVVQRYLSERSSPDEAIGEFTQTWKSRSIKYEIPFNEVKDRYHYHDYRMGSNSLASVKTFYSRYVSPKKGVPPKRTWVIVEEKQKHMERINSLWRQISPGESLVKISDDTYPPNVPPEQKAFQYQPEFFLLSNMSAPGLLQKKSDEEVSGALSKWVKDACPKFDTPLGATFGADRAIRLAGFELFAEAEGGARSPIHFADPTTDHPVFQSGQKVIVRTFWQALKPINRELQLFIHAETGSNFRLRGDHSPVDSNYETTDWKVGQCVIDEYPVDIPKGHEGDLDILIGLFHDDSREPVVEGGAWRMPDNRVKLGTLDVKR